MLSVGSGSYGLWRATRTVSRMLAAQTVGPGPDESVILGDRQVLLAVTGFRRPRIVVSAGALVDLDDAELAAGLAHERGHIAHHHRILLLAAEILAAVARFLPGTRHAQQELVFHLERDADQFALARAYAPSSLASSICKAAESAFAGAAPALALGGSSVVRRLEVLLVLPKGARTRRTRSR